MVGYLNNPQNESNEMKKYIIIAALALGTGAVINSAMQSCTSLATTDLGLSVIKRLLLNGIDKGMNIYSSKEAFLQNNMVDRALPKQLRDINSTLERIAPSLVAKEREYIAEAAAYTVNTSRPILQNAVNSLSAQDVTRIIQGTTATQILKEKASQQLIAAIAPKVDEKLNQYGIVKTINTALSGNSLLGGLLGGSSSNTRVNAGGLSQLASEQLVNGLFYIIEDYEQQNSRALLGPLGK